MRLLICVSADVDEHFVPAATQEIQCILAASPSTVCAINEGV